MNVNKIFLIVFFLASCAKQNEHLTVKIPQNPCAFEEKALNFEPVKDLSSALRNQELASIYFYEQKQKTLNLKLCYEKIINELNL